MVSYRKATIIKVSIQGTSHNFVVAHAQEVMVYLKFC